MLFMVLKLILFVLIENALAATDYSCMHRKSWLVNDDNTRIKTTQFTGLVDISTAFFSIMNGIAIFSLKFSGLPEYDHVITQSDLDRLHSRPKKISDFVGGMPNVTLGERENFQKCSEKN